MENNNSNELLKQRILDKVKNQKPTNGSVYKIWDGILLASILGLVLIASFIIGFFWWDFRRDSDFLEISSESLWSLLPELFLEIAILVGILSLITYFLYRKTDFWWVKQRLWLVVVFWILVIGLGVGLTILAENQKALSDQYQNAKTGVEKLPFRPRRLEKIYDKQKEQGLFPGRVQKIEKVGQDKFEITVKNPLEEKTFTVDKPLLKGVQKGDPVEIVLDPQNPDQVIGIRKGMSRGMMPNRP